jgi:hypothetical protein
MLRREFLQALAMAAIVPTIAMVATPAHAVAEVLPVVVVNPNQKFIDALALYDRVIAAHQAKAGHYVVHKRVDDMLEYVLANFEKPVLNATNLAVVADILDDRTRASSARLREVEPYLSEVAWPVAAMKSFLSEYRIPLSPKTSKRFADYVDQYKEIIISNKV